MFVFLMRLIYQDMADGGGSGVTNITQTVAQTLMTRISVPFSLSLASATDNRDVKLQLSSNVGYHIRAFWGVDIPTFHHVLRAPWPWFQEALLRGRLFGDKCLDYGGVQISRAPHEERTEQVVRRGDKLDLGPAPRDVYPLVLVMVRSGDDFKEDMTEVTGMLSVIHLRDDVCPIPSQVLVTYLRQGSGVTLLRPLYLSEEGGGECSDTESAEGSDTEESVRLGAVVRCVICQLERVTRVSLPCRHAVTCKDCFNRCQNRCPMCRGHVSSYFLLSPESNQQNESESNMTEEKVEDVRRNTWGQMWNRWNNRINTMMGVRENLG